MGNCGSSHQRGETDADPPSPYVDSVRPQGETVYKSSESDDAALESNRSCMPAMPGSFVESVGLSATQPTTDCQAGHVAVFPTQWESIAKYKSRVRRVPNKTDNSFILAEDMEEVVDECLTVAKELPNRPFSESVETGLQRSSFSNVHVSEYSKCTDSEVNVRVSLLPYHIGAVKGVITCLPVGKLPALVHAGLLFEVLKKDSAGVIWATEVTFSPWFNNGSVVFYKPETCDRMGLHIHQITENLMIYQEDCTPAEAMASFASLVRFTHKVEEHPRWNFVFLSAWSESPKQQQAGNLNCQSFAMLGAVIAAASLPRWANQSSAGRPREEVLIEVADTLFCNCGQPSCRSIREPLLQQLKASGEDVPKPDKGWCKACKWCKCGGGEKKDHSTRWNRIRKYAKFITLNRGSKFHHDMFREYLDLLKEDGMIQI